MDRSTLVVDCTEADFRTSETALYQILRRTTTNEPLGMVQQVQGRRGFEAWHMIVRKYDQRNTSDRSLAYAALISNIKTNKYDGRCGNTRDEECGTTLRYEELLIPLENIIIDKVTTQSASKVKKN